MNADQIQPLEELPRISKFHYDNERKLIVSEFPEIYVQHVHVRRDQTCGFRLIWGHRDIYFSAIEERNELERSKKYEVQWTLRGVGLIEAPQKPVYHFKNSREYKTAVLLASGSLTAYGGIHSLVDQTTVTGVELDYYLEVSLQRNWEH